MWALGGMTRYDSEFRILRRHSSPSITIMSDAGGEKGKEKENEMTSTSLAFQAILSIHDAGPNNISETAIALRSLAESSKKSESTRQQLEQQQPILLNTLTSLLYTHSSASSTLPDTDKATSTVIIDSALRCIANTCTNNDNHTARDVLCSAAFFPWASTYLSSSQNDFSIRLLTTKVLNNICHQHEVSQRICYEENVHWGLIRFLNEVCGKGLDDGELDGAINVLFEISGQKTKSTTSLPDDILSGLLNLHSIRTAAEKDHLEPWSHDIETFATLSETIVVFLRDEEIQKQIISNELFPQVWQLLERQEKLISQIPREGEEEEEDRKLMLPLQASLVWCLSDMAAIPTFATTYSHNSEVITQLTDVIHAAADTARRGCASSGEHTRSTANRCYPEKFQGLSASSPLFNAAAQILGNMLWTTQQQQQQQASLNGNHTESLPYDLLDIVVSLPESLSTPNNSNPSTWSPSPSPDTADSLHSITGLLIQLSRPSVAIREEIGAYEYTVPAIRRLCGHAREEVRQGAVKLVKALGRECVENQRRFGEMVAELARGQQQQQERRPIVEEGDDRDIVEERDDGEGRSEVGGDAGTCF